MAAQTVFVVITAVTFVVRLADALYHVGADERAAATYQQRQAARSIARERHVG